MERARPAAVLSEAAIIRRPPPQPRSRTLSGRPSCRIYHGRRAWLLEFETGCGGWMEPWADQGRIPLEPKTLAFPTMAAAVGYAERHGYDYRIEPPAVRPRRSMRRRRQRPSWLVRLPNNTR